jgi:hypothetical protein
MPGNREICGLALRIPGKGTHSSQKSPKFHLFHIIDKKNFGESVGPKTAPLR